MTELETSLIKQNSKLQPYFSEVIATDGRQAYLQNSGHTSLEI